jgi:OPT oligopeptide transporter protein
MSRTPLLLRSSPLSGTGSYGVLPVQLPAHDDDIGFDGATDQRPTMSQGTPKGKSRRALRRTMSAGEEQGFHPDGGESSTHALGKSASHQEVHSRRRKSVSAKEIKDSLRHTLSETVEGAQESGLESRFTGGGMPAFPTGPSSIFESLDSSKAPSNYDEVTTEDDEEGTSSSSEPGSHKINIPPPSPDDNSPYAQVRASVPPTDDTTLSINTPRMWTLSILFAVFGSSTNLFFSLRYPSVSITPVIALLIVHPLGLLWDRLLKRNGDPEGVFENGSLLAYADIASRSTNGSPTGTRHPPIEASITSFGAGQSWRTRLRLWLAQGKWNEKEHCCVFISSNVSFGFAFATDVSQVPIPDIPLT